MTCNALDFLLVAHRLPEILQYWLLNTPRALSPRRHAPMPLRPYNSYSLVGALHIAVVSRFGDFARRLRISADKAMT